LPFGPTWLAKHVGILFFDTGSGQPINVHVPSGKLTQRGIGE
jgi:hypothetical protein